MDALWAGSCDWPAAIREDEAAELRRGPWTVEEDALLAGYVTAHGEGRWNELARAAGLRRTGKSCRLRWLNYLRPGVRRGDFTPREQLLILELHFRWGNRWSKIAAHLPGRTDNEVKNYWRTRVQKHAKQFGCDVGSRQFHDVMRHLWMPRLLERIHADSAATAAAVEVSHPVTTSSAAAQALPAYQDVAPSNCARRAEPCASPDLSCVTGSSSSEASPAEQFVSNSPIMTSAGAGWSTERCQYGSVSATSCDMFDGSWSELLARSGHDDADSAGLLDFRLGETVDNLWSLDDIWQQQLY